MLREAERLKEDELQQVFYFSALLMECWMLLSPDNCMSVQWITCPSSRRKMPSCVHVLCGEFDVLHCRAELACL